MGCHSPLRVWLACYVTQASGRFQFLTLLLKCASLLKSQQAPKVPYPTKHLWSQEWAYFFYNYLTNITPLKRSLSLSKRHFVTSKKTPTLVKHYPFESKKLETPLVCEKHRGHSRAPLRYRFVSHFPYPPFVPLARRLAFSVSSFILK